MDNNINANNTDSIEQSATRRLETANSLELAMPQLIPQDKLSLGYVNGWKLEAEKALRLGRHITQYEMDSRSAVLFHWAKSSVSGVWFIALDGKSVDYLYAYQSIKLEGIHRASEALAYLFTDDVRGVTKEVFFDRLLPNQKFVVTDSIYTPDGHRWFKTEYAYAFRKGYKVYAIDLTAKKYQHVRQIDKEEFVKLQPLYWGLDDAHQKYRFAIEQT